MAYEKLKRELSSKLDRANRYGDVNQKYIDNLVKLLENNISVCKRYLIEHSGNYTFGVRFNNSSIKLKIAKTGDDFTVSSGEYDDTDFCILFTTRASYLKQSLSNPFGSEILFVGSGGIFTYKEKADALVNLHNEFKTIIAFHKSCPNSRFGKSSKHMFKLKKMIKSVLRIQQNNLYDLNAWVKFKQ